MMKKTIIILLVSMFISCEEEVFIIPDDVMVHYQTFQKEAAKRGYTFPLYGRVSFVSDETMPDAMAKSYIEGIGKWYIDINIRYWELMSFERREALIMHELGHAILRREHSSNKESVMYEGWTGLLFHTKNREQSFNELFNVN